MSQQILAQINIDLGSRSYNINIANNLDPLIEFIKNANYKKIFVITDENIAKLHLTDLSNRLAILNLITLKNILVTAGEASKSFEVFQRVSEEIVSYQPDRKTLIIAFGGGVVGDLAGFVASTMMRGIDFIQLPTTLLAMVDSSVGGKTAINSSFGKNLIGTFYQPKMVLCNLEFLKTLPKRQFINGYAEILKYGLIDDKEFFYWLQNNCHLLLKNNNINEFNEVLTSAITRSCQIKAKIVSADEKEQNIRAILNFGHSFAHLFESETGYSDLILHGEAVAIGMNIANYLAVKLSLISVETMKQIENHLLKAGFNLNPYLIKSNWDLKILKQAIFFDKKNQDSSLTFIVLESIGKAKICKTVTFNDFSILIDEYFSLFTKLK